MDLRDAIVRLIRKSCVYNFNPEDLSHVADDAGQAQWEAGL